MSVVLTPGIDLSARTLLLSIPSGTTVSEDVIVARCGSNNLIGERVSGGVTQGYIQYDDGESNIVTEIFYTSNGTNPDSIDIPAGFGAITEINEDAVLYPYIQRNENEKTYLITEDMGREEYNPPEMWDYLVVERISVTLDVEDGEAFDTITLSKDGYKPLGIVGIDKTYVVVPTIYVMDCTIVTLFINSSTGNLTYRLKNISGGGTTKKIAFYILWAKE